jgi:A/G-specific adenine glycosylase
LRLHEAAASITERHGGQVPSDHDALRALAGVGEYTAAAVASFAFGARHVVIDTNVRRVLARVAAGVADQPPSAESRRLVESYLPDDPTTAAMWAAASMELGALVCTARSPRCEACPLSDLCAWKAAFRPALAAPVRRPQLWQGTDRQCRGALLRVVREAEAPVPRQILLATWPDQDQAARSLDSLLADGLVMGTDSLSLFG